MQATPFDAPDAVWNDRGDKCTFDVMVEELGLATDALSRLAMIVRGADTGQLDLTPQSAACSPRRLAIRACIGTISPSSRRRCPLTMPLPLVPGRDAGNARLTTVFPIPPR